MDGFNWHTWAGQGQRWGWGGAQGIPGKELPALVSAPFKGVLLLLPCIHPRVNPVIQQLILTERAHGPGPGLGTCHLACPLMASASQGGRAGGLSGSQSSGLWLHSGHSEGMGWAWFACPAFTQTCSPPGPCPPLCLPPHSWLSMGYWPCSLGLRQTQRNSCDVPLVLATQVSLRG